MPTWNYSEVQLRGSVTVHDDPDWVLDVVTGLTERHESGRERPWAVTDAPPAYVRGQLRAIVGVELVVEHASESGGRGQGEAQPEPLRRRPPGRHRGVASRG